MGLLDDYSGPDKKQFFDINVKMEQNLKSREEILDLMEENLQIRSYKPEKENFFDNLIRKISITLKLKK